MNPEKYPHLTSPIQLGRVIFRNRMFSAPMGATDITPECNPGPRTQGFYELRAKGGAGSVTVSELVVHPETDASHMLHLNLETVGSLAAHTFLADAIRRHGAVPSIELSHSGQYAGTYMADKNKKASLCQWGPSEGVRPDGRPVKELSKEQIKEIVKAYADNATLCKRAGYEMIMVHGGHGWLIHQFLSPFQNHRTDEYGGSLDNRIRLAREVLTAVREAVGPGFPIEFRMSGSELFEGGYGVEEGCYIAHAIEDLVDLIHVSAGSYQFGFFDTTPPMWAPHGVNVWLASEIKKHVSKPVATVGGLGDPAEMEKIIAEGKADVVYMARQLLADPYLPQKVESGKDDRIIRCLRCYTCMAERPTTFTRRCAVNPLIGREIEGMDITPAYKKKKVLIAGAGVAGLEAAVTAAKRGHKVILCEKSDKVGGILKSEQAISFKLAMYNLGLTLERLALDEGVEIRLNTVVTPEYVEKEKPDALILAVGSNPLIPKLPGIDGENVVVVNNYYREKEKVGDTVVVLGGGLAGCECAIHLGMEGKKVHLVEMRDTLAPDCNIRNRPILLRKVSEFVTETHLECAGQEITPEGLICKDKDGNEILIPGKTIICAVGQRSNRADADALHRSAPFVREIGDCLRPANITKAVYEGYHAALDI
ncbi:MAG: NAD(P)/FAD-dependent oxidoreductase [Bacteroidaceae bacterium]|nr:NAD(P)/FAD-dependent oxidoreductase [Bacteroidaceae bacterium]